MKGTINRFKNALGLNGRKKVGRGNKRRSGAATVFRDYRGTRGAIKDAEGKK